MPPHVSPTVLMGFYFFPRGGSAQVARSLCRALRTKKWAPTLFAGSLGGRDDSSNARQFFRHIRCETLDYSPARWAWVDGGDSMAGSVPMHASYEDKFDVPDRVFFDLDDAAFQRQVTSWQRFLGEHTTVTPDVVHLHHLTPMHEAVRQLWPTVPIVTHLHGTELKLLASVHGANRSDDPHMWTGEWVQRMRNWAADSARLVVVSAQDQAVADEVLDVLPNRVSIVANGVDAEVFTPRVRHPVERLALWKRWLVDEPRGWRPGGAPGSVAYTADDLSAFTGSNGNPVPVVVFAGRFMRFKRVQLLIEAHHAMRTSTHHPSVLIIVGGFPGEWEGEHPYDTVQRLGAQGVFFLGWRDHDELAEILNCSDVFAAPSVDEPFGLVYLEAMAAGLPAIATGTGGPLTFINIDPDHPTGWLVPPDDVQATAGALAHAVSDHGERAGRGRRAARFVRHEYSWASSADSFIGLYNDIIDEREGSLTFSPSAR
ncbi:MAG: hypothetical protein JWN99_1358 [Ilumatobacteraceae bacterium]|nr:hypothetical protein [Ilumatobacteraceae bacterium]